MSTSGPLGLLVYFSHRLVSHMDKKNDNRDAVCENVQKLNKGRLKRIFMWLEHGVVNYRIASLN